MGLRATETTRYRLNAWRILKDHNPAESYHQWISVH